MLSRCAKLNPDCFCVYLYNTKKVNVVCNLTILSICQYQKSKKKSDIVTDTDIALIPYISFTQS